MPEGEFRTIEADSFRVADMYCREHGHEITALGGPEMMYLLCAKCGLYLTEIRTGMAPVKTLILS